MAGIFNSILGRIMKPVIRQMSRNRHAQHSGVFQVEGISAKVEVRRDAQGVPYVYADSQEDMFFAQGFVHCQDRMWQMEINRRVALGRLSEVFGEAALDADRASRTFGFARMAVQDMALVEPALLAQLEAYTKGVNACLKEMGKKLPIEFKLAGFAPEPWTMLDVVAFTRLMTLQLSNGWGHELARTKLYQFMDPELAAELDMRTDQRNPVTLPNGIETFSLGADGKLEAMQGPYLRQQGGSNAWVVSGRHTDTGKPYLCGDPHLSLTVPGIWYQIYLESPDFRCQGTSIPGMPLIMIGHNAHISWSITLAFTDIQDLFIEKFEENGSGRYLHKDEWCTPETHAEAIRIKGKETPYIENVVVTRNGPLISDVFGQSEKYLALNSPALRPSALTMGWWKMDQAKNWDDFVAAMKYIDAPGLNVIYADVADNIGHWVTGKTPIRASGNGEFPSEAWTGKYDWVDRVPFEEMPHNLNPARGFIVSANHKIVGDDYPYFMGNNWMNGYRARRIEELLGEKATWRLEDFPAIHMDVRCIPGLEFAAHYRAMDKPENPAVAVAWQALLDWDGELGLDSVGGTIYQVCKHEMAYLLYRVAARDSGGLSWLMGTGVHPIFAKVTEFHGKEIVALLEMLEKESSPLMDLAGGKARVMLTALEAGVAYLEEKLGKSPQNWRWGRLHHVEFQHSMAVKPPMDKVFNVGPAPIYGDTDTVCQTSIRPDSPYLANLALPSYRQIIDMADFDRSLWVMPPGQSGQLGHPNYDSQVEPWLKGAYFPMLWERKSIEKAAPEVLNLEPKRIGATG